jgi:four helix bundle protein
VQICNRGGIRALSHKEKRKAQAEAQAKDPNPGGFMRYQNFTQMPVWKKAFELMLKIYQITKAFPRDERFGLTSDMRRSANSTVHNIAEGFGRYYPKEKSHFYRISRGSCYELWSQILAACSLSYLSREREPELVGDCQEVINDLDKLMKSLSN